MTTTALMNYYRMSLGVVISSIRRLAKSFVEL
jgi:hypothetical protein